MKILVVALVWFAAFTTFANDEPIDSPLDSGVIAFPPDS